MGVRTKGVNDKRDGRRGEKVRGQWRYDGGA